jgi:hypothetical protein
VPAVIGFDAGLPAVGADTDHGQQMFRWSGKLDDVVLYGRVLGRDEICKLAAPTTCADCAR